MRTWQYMTSFVAFVCTGILLVTNLLAAWSGTDEGIWRWIMLSISAAADIGMVGFLFSIIHNHQSNRMGAVFAAIVMWSLCGLYTGVSSMRWLEGKFRTATAPIKEEAARRVDLNRYIDTAVNAENVALGQAMSVSVNGSTQNKRDEAKAEAEKIRKRITELLQKKWPAAVEPSKVAHSTVEHTFIGYEWAFPLTLLLFSQGGWYVTFGSFGHGSYPNDSLGEPNNGLGEPKTKVVSPKTKMVEPETKPTAQETTLLPNENLKVVVSNSPTLCEIAQPINPNDGLGEPKTIAVQPKKPPSPTKQPSATIIHFATTDERVADLIREGLSERKIADRLNTTRSVVRRVKQEMLSSVVSATG